MEGGGSLWLRPRSRGRWPFRCRTLRSPAPLPYALSSPKLVKTLGVLLSKHASTLPLNRGRRARNCMPHVSRDAGEPSEHLRSKIARCSPCTQAQAQASVRAHTPRASLRSSFGSADNFLAASRALRAACERRRCESEPCTCMFGSAPSCRHFVFGISVFTDASSSALSHSVKIWQKPTRLPCRFALQLHGCHQV